MQRDSDTADSGTPRIALWCVKRSMSKSVAVLPHVWKIHYVSEAVNNVSELIT